MPSSRALAFYRELVSTLPGGDFIVEPVSEVAASFPDDAFAPNQRPAWDLVRAPAAWDSIRGEQGSVVVAVVDGGTDWRHPDLVSNVWLNSGEIAGNGIDDDGNGFVDDVRGWNFSTNESDPTGDPLLPINAAHGTHVAGLIGASTNNTIGTAGVSWNARIMPVNVAHPASDRRILYGYDGILYAALNGADVINCSWRTASSIGGEVSSARFNSFHLAVVEAAESLGSVVVAAVGNDSAEEISTTPGFFPTVLSVSATRFDNDEAWPWSNTARWIDLAAPGASLLSTFPQDQPSNFGPYDFLSGTSMSAAVVSGVAALVLTRHPEWSPSQVKEHLRWTASPLTNGRRSSGVGLVRADLATTSATTPGLKLSEISLVDADADGLVEANEVQDLSYKLESLFDYDGPVEVVMEVDDPFVVPLITRQRLPRVQPGAPLEIIRGLTLWIHPNVPQQHIVRVGLRASTDTVIGPERSFYVEVNPIRASVATDKVAMEAAFNGRFGESREASYWMPGGPGLRLAGDAVGVLETGSLVLATSASAVSDAIGPLDANGLDFEDFQGFQGRAMEMILGPEGRRELHLVYSDRAASMRLGITVEQTLFADQDSQDHHFVISEWLLKPTDVDLVGMKAGLFMNWRAVLENDAGVMEPSTERIEFDQSRDEHWATAAATGSVTRYGGAVVLAAPTEMNMSWVPVFEEAGGRAPLYDLAQLESDLPDSVIWELFSRLPDSAPSAEGNLSTFLASRGFDLAVGESERLAIGLAVAPSLEELRESFDAARVAYRDYLRTRGLLPTSVSFATPSPNPFQRLTALSFSLPDDVATSLRVYDLRGRRVRQLLDQVLSAGVHTTHWDATDDNGGAVANGVYFFRFEAAGKIEVRKVTVLR